jgi:hypothetical protein
MQLFKVTLIVFLAIVMSGVHSTDQLEHKAIRVGGEYIVESINSPEPNSFKISFRAMNPSGKYDLLVLQTDHLNYLIEKGMKIRLSAEIISEKNSSAEVSQIVLYLKRPEGDTPVWMLSNRYRSDKLNATGYIKMHAPQTDYVVF